MMARLGRLLAASLACTMLGGGITFAATAPPLAMDQLSDLTPHAEAGLFTAVTRAGDRLVAVGERGRILLSDDNGASWRQVSVPTSVTLTQVRFATPRLGWAAGQMGIVLNSKDGGQSWTKQFDGDQAGQVMLAAAQADLATQGSNDTTTNSLQAAQSVASGGPDNPFLAIQPLSPERVIITGAFGVAFKSNDGGASWLSIADAIPNPNGLHIYGMAQNDGAIIAVGEQGLMFSMDKTGHAAGITTPFQGTLFGVLFTKNHAIIAFGLQGTVLRSADQGKTWAEPNSKVTSGIDAGTMIDDGTLALGDIAGDILISADDGRTFTLHAAGEPVAGITQAADGALIVAGPLGLRRLARTSLDSGG